jgi:predicted lipoprotein with Yx(FWY)xxD motif
VTKNLVVLGIAAFGLALGGCSSGGGSTAGAVGGYPGVNPPVAAPPPAPNPGTSATAGDAKEVMLKGALAFVDSRTGLALYTFGGDTVPDQSECTGSCLQVWPAHAATAKDKASSGFTIFTRSDNGTLQWAYLGKPLYTFVSDTVSNNGTGDGVENFHIARPQASATASPTAQPSPGGGGGRY